MAAISLRRRLVVQAATFAAVAGFPALGRGQAAPIARFCSASRRSCFPQRDRRRYRSTSS